MGDHAYDIGNANDRRGDAYMNAWQPALTTLPWLPIIGNHEWVYRLKPGDENNGTWGDGNDIGDGDTLSRENIDRVHVRSEGPPSPYRKRHRQTV